MTATWQRGHSLEELRLLTAPFARQEEGVAFSPFARTRETDVATALDRGEFFAFDGASWVGAQLGKAAPIRDFTGEERMVLPAGTVLVKSLAVRDAEAAARDLVHWWVGFGTRLPPLALWLWQESTEHMEVARRLSLKLECVKVGSGSELRGLWGHSLSPADHRGLPGEELLGLARLSLEVDVSELAVAVTHLAMVPHYSSYTEKHSWHALALRSFGGSARTIEKPAEMSRKWKREHPEELKQPCVDTELRWTLPEVEPILSALPTPSFQRVRLMKLDPGGGLGRHADVTDKQAGTQPGKLLRIHIPVETNHACEFYSWRADGRKERAHMGVGEAWYLDTRKPHSAYNRGSVARIHLVCDCASSPELLKLLGVVA